MLAVRRLLPRRVLRARAIRRLPRVANVEVTTKCDLACPLCPTHVVERRAPMIEEAAVAGVLAVADGLRDVCFHVQGEPLLHPRLFEFVDRFEEKGVRTHFSTNGKRLRERVPEIVASRLSSISIAIDGVRQEDYGRYRTGGDVEGLLEGVRALVDARGESPTPRIQLQLILFPYLEERLSEEVRVLESLGADVVEIKRASLDVDPRPFAARLGERRVDQALARARAFASSLRGGVTRFARMGGRLHRDEPLCPQLEKATVLCDGRVVACSLDADGGTAYGSVLDHSLAEIWRSDARRELLAKFQAGALPLCASCALGSAPKSPGPARS